MGKCFFLVLFAILLRFGDVLGSPSGGENRNLRARFLAVFFSSAFWNQCFGDFFWFFSSSNLDFCAHGQSFRAFSQN